MRNTWIAIVNVKKYAIFAALDNLKNRTLSWGVKNRNKFNVGDIVYLYLGAPLQLVKYRCKIVDIFLRSEKAPVNDDVYIFNDDRLKVSKSDEFINIKCLSEIKNNELTRENIEKKGFKFNQTAIRQLDDNIVKYFESVINR